MVRSNSNRSGRTPPAPRSVAVMPTRRALGVLGIFSPRTCWRFASLQSAQHRPRSCAKVDDDDVIGSTNTFVCAVQNGYQWLPLDVTLHHATLPPVLPSPPPAPPALFFVVVVITMFLPAPILVSQEPAPMSGRRIQDSRGWRAWRARGVASKRRRICQQPHGEKRRGSITSV